MGHMSAWNSPRNSSKNELNSSLLHGSLVIALSRKSSLGKYFLGNTLSVVAADTEDESHRFTR